MICTCKYNCIHKYTTLGFIFQGLLDSLWLFLFIMTLSLHFTWIVNTIIHKTINPYGLMFPTKSIHSFFRLTSDAPTPTSPLGLYSRTYRWFKRTLTTSYCAVRPPRPQPWDPGDLDIIGFIFKALSLSKGFGVVQYSNLGQTHLVFCITIPLIQL